GSDRVDWSRAYVIMSNHQSHFDIPVLFATIKGTMRMITKKELFRVPIWGRAMERSGFVKIDRGDRKSAIASLRDAGDQIRRGTHFGTAPEGTRRRAGRLGPLKKGGFLLARETGVPILPVVVDGTRDILPPDTYDIRRGARVTVRFGAPIETAGA